MVFRTREREDGDFELVLDTEGIDYLEQGLTELRYMDADSGTALACPSFTEDGASHFLLKRVPDAH